ncbi:hypothetical protein [Nonomuraea dietziae]
MAKLLRPTHQYGEAPNISSPPITDETCAACFGGMKGSRHAA